MIARTKFRNMQVCLLSGRTERLTNESQHCKNNGLEEKTRKEGICAISSLAANHGEYRCKLGTHVEAVFIEKYKPTVVAQATEQPFF